MIRADRAKYTHMHAGSKWRMWVMDEPGDVVIGVDHLSMDGQLVKWDNAVRCDESGHLSYHIHVSPNMDIRVDIPHAITREQKLKIGFDEISRLASSGKIKVGEDSMSAEDVWLALRDQAAEQKASPGTAMNSASISATASVVSTGEVEIQGN